MSDQLGSKLDEHSLRKNRPAWLEHFRSVCCPDAQESDFLPRDEADVIRASFYEKLKSATGLRKAEYHTAEPIDAIELLREIGRSIGDTRAVLLETRAGAIEAPAQALLIHADKLWQPEKLDFCVVSRDLRHGVCAEMNPWHGSGSRHDRPYFEVRAWGDYAPDAPRR